MGLRDLRIEQGLTQQQLSDASKVHIHALQNFESGRRKIGGMSLDVSLRICDALHIKNPFKLFDDETIMYCRKTCSTGLRELRVERGLTQKQLGETAEIPRSRIAAFETGQREIGGMSLDVAYRLCKALRVSNPRRLLEPDVLPKPERKPSKPRKPRVTLEDMNVDEIDLIVDDENPDDLIDDLDEEA